MNQFDPHTLQDKKINSTRIFLSQPVREVIHKSTGGMMWFRTNKEFSMVFFEACPEFRTQDLEDA